MTCNSNLILEISLIICHGRCLTLSLYEPVSLSVNVFFHVMNEGKGVFVGTPKTENDWLLVCAHSWAPNNKDESLPAQAHIRSPLDWRSTIDKLLSEMWGITQFLVIRSVRWSTRRAKCTIFNIVEENTNLRSLDPENKGSSWWPFWRCRWVRSRWGQEGGSMWMQRCAYTSAEFRPADEVRDERKGECHFIVMKDREICSDGECWCNKLTSRLILVRIEQELILSSLPLLSKSSGVNKWVGYPRSLRCRRLFFSLTPIYLLSL